MQSSLAFLSTNRKVKPPALSHKTRQGQGTPKKFRMSKGWASPLGRATPGNFGWASPQQKQSFIAGTITLTDYGFRAPGFDFTNPLYNQGLEQDSYVRRFSCY